MGTVTVEISKHRKFFIMQCSNPSQNIILLFYVLCHLANTPKKLEKLRKNLLIGITSKYHD